MTRKIFDYNLFYSNYKQRSTLFVKSYLHDDDIVEDVVTDAFVKIWELSKDEFLETPEFLLFRILKNRCLDVLRHEAMKRKVFSELLDIENRELEFRIQALESSDPESIFSKDIQKIINETLKLLPKQTRNIFEKYRIDGVDKKKVAEHFNMTLKGVDYHIFKAVELFKITLKDYLPLLVIFLINFL